MKDRRHLRRTAPLLGMLCALAWTFSPAAAPLTEQPFERVFARFNTPLPPAYRALRHMEAGVPGTDRQAKLDVWTQYQPSEGFRYDVVRESGDDYVREHVLRKLLKEEQALLATGRPLRASLEPRNYAFGDGGLTASGLQRVMLHPLRKAEGIINGVLFVEPRENRVVKLEGRLVKSPSFWVRDVDVTWQYTRVNDHIMPTEMSSTARVRFYGKSYFKMTYSYASIEGQATETRD